MSKAQAACRTKILKHRMWTIKNEDGSDQTVVEVLRGKACDGGFYIGQRINWGKTKKANEMVTRIDDMVEIVDDTLEYDEGGFYRITEAERCYFIEQRNLFAKNSIQEAEELGWDGTPNHAHETLPFKLAHALGWIKHMQFPCSK